MEESKISFKQKNHDSHIGTTLKEWNQYSYQLDI